MDGLFGRLAVHSGVISMEQLAQATQHQARIGDGRMLGQVLVELGHLSYDRLKELLMYQEAYAEAASIGLEPPSASAHTHRPKPHPKPALSPPPPRPEVKHPPHGPLQLSPSGIYDMRNADGRVDLLRTCLREATALGASDVHAHANSPLRIRLHGRLAQYGGDILGAAELERTLLSLIPKEAKERFQRSGQVNFVHLISEIGRCRTQVYRQMNGLDAVFHLLPSTPPSLTAMGLPVELARLTNFDHGLVLIVGRSGCGKSSTLAALVDLINEERATHIVTVEDPIEFVHPRKRAAINQRQVGEHTKSVTCGLRAAMREDADVIVLSELEDPEAIALALEAAETGHLVLSTMHTANVEHTLNRLQHAFPIHRHAWVRAMLADTLRAIITQRLVPTIHNDERVPALGHLIVTPAIGNLIRDDKINQIYSVLQTTRNAGNCLLDDSLAQLVQARLIGVEDALRAAVDAAHLAKTCGINPNKSLAAAGRHSAILQRD